MIPLETATDCTLNDTPGPASSQTPLTARAKVNTSTCAAPARRSAPAHSDAVAPVVNTSSTSRILRSLTTSGCLVTKAPRTRSTRSRRLACLVDRPEPRRRSRSVNTGTPSVRPTPTARSAAWLYPREMKRAGLRGTQATMSGPGRPERSQVAAIIIPIPPAESHRLAYFKDSTMPLIAPAQMNTARADDAGSRRAQMQESRSGAPQRLHSGSGLTRTVWEQDSQRSNSLPGSTSRPQEGHAGWINASRMVEKVSVQARTRLLSRTDPIPFSRNP